ncbi:DUF2141 domain-containing protein [Shivajiella indica]|uniref:DUF2141 domain-containing protein n=1 Tax=Shivajiella indica TaxID=872115 RepID=A0ABW5BEB0_9BACT
MKTIFLFLFLVGVLFTDQSSANLTLTVNKVKNDKGVVRVLLFDKSAGFPDVVENAVRNASVDIKGDKAVITFNNLPAGTYALSVFHDSENTGKLRTNAFGIPRDGYGFSNNASGTFGPPSFEKAAFKVNAGENKVSIDLK